MSDVAWANEGLNAVASAVGNEEVCPDSFDGESVANQWEQGRLCSFADQPVAEIIQCGEPIFSTIYRHSETHSGAVCRFLPFGFQETGPLLGVSWPEHPVKNRMVDRSEGMPFSCVRQGPGPALEPRRGRHRHRAAVVDLPPSAAAARW